MHSEWSHSVLNLLEAQIWLLYWTYSYTFFPLTGRDVFYEHVKKYELEFSTDGVSWQPYQEGGAKKVNFCPLLVRGLGEGLREIRGGGYKTQKRKGREVGGLKGWQVRVIGDKVRNNA